MSKVLDFVKFNGWGHAFHTSTWHEEPRKQSLWNRLRRHDDMIRHYSVMVHHTPMPEVGDTIRWKSKSLRGYSEGEVFKVQPCFNPGDMYTLKFEIRPEHREDV
jgi:hypothetical protein